jgi:hypothetical protein
MGGLLTLVGDSGSARRMGRAQRLRRDRP